MGITHAMVSAKDDGPDDTLVRPSDWNAGHVISDGLDMGGESITTLGAPVADTDAATKKYVDDQIVVFDPAVHDWSTLPTSDPNILGTLYTDGVPSGGQPKALMVSGGPGG